MFVRPSWRNDSELNHRHYRLRVHGGRRTMVSAYTANCSLGPSSRAELDGRTGQMVPSYLGTRKRDGFHVLLGSKPDRLNSLHKRLSYQIFETSRSTLLFPDEDIMTYFLRQSRSFKQWGFAIALIANLVVCLPRHATADIFASADFSTYSNRIMGPE